MNRSESREQAFIFLFESTFGFQTAEEIIENSKIARKEKVSEFSRSLFENTLANKEKIDTYYNKLASEVADKEKEKILKRMTKEIDDYLIVIVTDNNEEIWKIIEKNL